MTADVASAAIASAAIDIAAKRSLKARRRDAGMEDEAFADSVGGEPGDIWIPME